LERQFAQLYTEPFWGKAEQISAKHNAITNSNIEEIRKHHVSVSGPPLPKPIYGEKEG
jgi:hypothetical protein